MSDIRKRIEAAKAASDSLPEWAKQNLYFSGGAIQPGHEKLHHPEFFIKPGAKVSKAKLRGYDRNSLCPCSSGKKFKNCCIGRLK
jgi:uncharacterized protein YecA (UPF0149 family)